MSAANCAWLAVSGQNADVVNVVSSKAAPAHAVLDAFGLVDEPAALLGGGGRCFRVGDVVLKPVDDAEEAAWCAAVLDRIGGDGFRVPQPVRACDGLFVAAGWSAASRVDGASGPDVDWAGLLSAGRAFHRAIRDEPRPSFFDRREDRWAVADRVAWGEASIEPLDLIDDLLHSLCKLLHPVDARNQIIHGDLSSNVLFAPGQAPAIIDFSPYWRPVAYADAIIAVDGLLWFGTGPELIALASSGARFPQMLVRALVFRLVALNEKARAVGLECLVGKLEMFEQVVVHVRELVNGVVERAVSCGVAAGEAQQFDGHR